MSATLYSLNRHRDVSGVSGEGDDVATIAEFPSGLVAMHWNSDTPTIEVLTDLRHVTKLHAHGGASTLQIFEPRLVTAYKRVVPLLLSDLRIPTTVAPHPDHPDRLRLTFKSKGIWAFWVALLDGSTHAAVHEEVNGEMEHRWVSADGNVWCVWYSPIDTAGSAWDRHDDPEVQP